MTLKEFYELSYEDRPRHFGALTIGDQLAYVRQAEALDLLIGGYPSESSLLAAVESLAEKGGSNENPTLH